MMNPTNLLANRFGQIKQEQPQTSQDLSNFFRNNMKSFLGKNVNFLNWNKHPVQNKEVNVPFFKKAATHVAIAYFIHMKSVRYINYDVGALHY